jgi:hypothetical protein
LHQLLGFQLFRLVGQAEGFDEFVQISIQDFLEAVESDFDSVVGHPALWEIIGPDFGATISRTHLGFPIG